MYGADMSEKSFVDKMENENIEKKIAELFAVDDQEDLDD